MSVQPRVIFFEMKQSGVMVLPRAHGFTLIELLIVLVVVAILAAVAVPNYSEHVRRAQRAEAVADLMEARHWMEQGFTLNSSYEGAVLPAEFSQSPKAGAGSKLYEIELAANPAVTGTTYTLLAKRIESNPDKCGTFTIDQSGQRGLIGPGPGANIAGCWGH